MKALFKSATSYELLALLGSRVGYAFSLSELAKAIHKDPANVLRELSKLRAEGLVRISQDRGNKEYALDHANPVAKKLVELFSVVESADFEKRFTVDWILAEDIPNMCPFFNKIGLDSFVKEFGKTSGRAYKKVMAIFREYHVWFYFGEQDAFEVGKHLVDRMESDPAFMDEVNHNIVRIADELRSFADKLPEDRLDKTSNKKLWGFYRDHEKIHSEFYSWCWIPQAADMLSNNLTDRGKKILTSIGVPEEKINEYLTILNQPSRPSMIKIEQDEFSEIGIKVQQDPQQLAVFKDLFSKFREEELKMFGLYEHNAQHEERFEQYVSHLIGSIRPDIKKDLQDHYAKYYYGKFLFTEEQGVYSFEHYLKALVRLVNGDADIRKTLEKDRADTAAALAKRNELIRQLALTPKQKQFFAAWGEFMVTKIYRRYAQIYALYRMVAVIEEIGKRLGLTIKQTKFMTTEEIRRALADGFWDADEIKQRVPFSVYYVDGQGYTFYSGAQAQRIAELIGDEGLEDVDEIHGQCGCPGVAHGRVKIVDVTADMVKVEEGDILVSISTQPDLLPAMKKAAAYVTNQGGVTSHAAIVARELNKPCVIGTKIATKVLHDGDEVEVDANRGVVNVINRV